MRVRYELSDASGRYSSGLFVRKASDNLPFESEIDLTTDMLPLMLAPKLAPAARPILDFEQPGPPTCLAGTADRLTVHLYAKHPNGRHLHWNLQLPGDTSAPWTLSDPTTAALQAARAIEETGQLPDCEQRWLRVTHDASGNR